MRAFVASQTGRDWEWNRDSPSRARRSARAWTARERLASGVGLDRTLLEVNMDPTDIDVLESRGGSGDAGAPSSSPGELAPRLCSRSARGRRCSSNSPPCQGPSRARRRNRVSLVDRRRARAPTSAPAPAPASGPARHAPASRSVPAPTTRAPTRAKYAAAPEPAPEPERTPASSLLAPPPTPGTAPKRPPHKRSLELDTILRTPGRGPALPEATARRSVGAPRERRVGRYHPVQVGRENRQLTERVVESDSVRSQV